MTDPQFNSDSTDSPLSRTMTSQTQNLIARLENSLLEAKAENTRLKQTVKNLFNRIKKKDRTIEKLHCDLDNAQDKIDELNQRTDPYSSDGRSVEDSLYSGDDE
ncbi:MAG: hypothetical protein AB1589_38560 [Cyanobacteriota bacterium]